MDFPSGHHSHHHHHHRRDEEDPEVYPPPGRDFGNPPPPRPPSDYGGMNAPPPPFQPTTHVYHTSHDAPRPYGYSDHAAPPPPPAVGSFGNYEYQPEGPPPPAPHIATHVQHVSNNEGDRPAETHHGHRFHMPSFVHHVSHVGGSGELSNRPTVKVYSKAQPDYSLTIRDGRVILALSDPGDESQHWYKDEKYSTKVKDEEGCPCFSLVNKASGLAIKHSVGESHPVQLVPYNPDHLDESILWTESRDLGDGFRAIRMVNNVHLNMDAFHGDKYSGGVHDGTQIVLWKWKKGENQRWKIVPY